MNFWTANIVVTVFDVSVFPTRTVHAHVSAYSAQNVSPSFSCLVHIVSIVDIVSNSLHNHIYIY